MSQNLILDEIEKHILTITLNRPGKKNAVNPEMYDRLLELLDDASTNDEVRVVVVRGSEGNLTSGNDLADFQDIGEDMEEGLSAFNFLKELAIFPKPIVTQVEGYAVGLGATMLLHSDLVIAEPDAQIKFPFVDLGVVPEAGSSLLLPRMAGYQQAAEIIFSAEFLPPEKGNDIGFINEIVDSSKLEDRVGEVSSMLASKPPGSLQESKRLMKEPYRDELLETIDREAKTFYERLMTDESMEAIAATLEGREPDFD